jgi:predicted component of type VI protein secretion system
MEIEVGVIGGSARWVFSQPNVRIGTDPKCDISLAAGSYPSVAKEHVTLDMTNNAVKLATVGGAGTFLNDNPAGEGFVVRSGDVLRLGLGGPELRIRFTGSVEAHPAGYEPTRVMQAPYEATRVMVDPARSVANPASERTQEKTRVIATPPPTTVSPAPSTAAGAVGRHGYSSETAPKTTVAPRPAPNAAAAPSEPAVPSTFGTAAVRAQDSRIQTHSPNPPSLSARGIEDEDTEMLEGKLNTMRTILLLNTVILAGMIIWIFVLNQHLAQTQKELNEMHAQAQTAVGQFTPALDSRLVVFEKRMDDIDLKMKAAQTEMVAGVDAKMKATEDHLVERMNTEIPAMLDKYINKKLVDVKH